MGWGIIVKRGGHTRYSYCLDLLGEEYMTRTQEQQNKQTSKQALEANKQTTTQNTNKMRAICMENSMHYSTSNSQPSNHSARSSRFQ